MRRFLKSKRKENSKCWHYRKTSLCNFPKSEMQYLPCLNGDSCSNIWTNETAYLLWPYKLNGARGYVGAIHCQGNIFACLIFLCAWDLEEDQTYFISLHAIFDRFFWACSLDKLVSTHCALGSPPPPFFGSISTMPCSGLCVIWKIKSNHITSPPPQKSILVFTSVALSVTFIA